MLEALHEARVEEFRRVLRACALACAHGRQALVLAVPRNEDPEGFLRALHRHAVRRAARPAIHVDGRCRREGRPILARIRTGLGLSEDPVLEPDAPFEEALDARERLFERLRIALDQNLATGDDSAGPGLLMVSADVSAEPDLRAFLEYLSPDGAPPEAIFGTGRNGRAVVVSVLPADEDRQFFSHRDSLEVLGIRPIEARDVQAAPEAAAALLRNRSNAPGSPEVSSSHPSQVPLHDLLAAGAFDQVLHRDGLAPRTRLLALIAAGRADEALALARRAPQMLAGRDLLGLAWVALSRSNGADASWFMDRVLGSGEFSADLLVLRCELALIRGDLEEALQQGRAAVAAATTPLQMARAFNAVAKASLSAGRPEEAEHAAENVLGMLPANHPEAIRAAHNLALVAMQRRRYAQAAALLQPVVVHADEAGLVFGAALARHNLAVALEHQGRYQFAFQFAREALDRLIRLGRPRNLAGALHTLADLLKTFGEWDRALALIQRAEAIARQAGADRVLSLCARTRGEVALLRGEPEPAVSWFQKAIEGFKVHGTTTDVCSASARLAESLLMSGRGVEAHAIASDVLQCATDDESLGRSWLVTGRVALEQGGPAQAWPDLDRARTTLKASGETEPFANACIALSDAASRLGDASTSARLVEEARSAIQGIQAQVPEEFRKSFISRPFIREWIGSQDERREDPHVADAPVISRLRARPRLREMVPQIVGDSEALQRVLVTIERVRNVAIPVLFVGESGTGKELFAEAVHRLSSRASGPFVRVNAAAFPDTLLLSELFGHEKGAFTDAHARRIGRFEAAHGGTLFLDEIGDVSERLQTALLRVLEDQSFQRVGGVETIHVDVRVVFATNRDLTALIKAGRFREDLYHRISAVTVIVPPLRERREDIPALVEAFAREVERETGRRVQVAPDALELLKSYSWPGNVRELRNAIRKAALMTEGATITPDLLLNEIPGLAQAMRPRARGGVDPIEMVFGRGMSLDEARREVEVALIREALEQSGGNIAAAARLLGMKRPRLSQLVKEYELKPLKTASGRREP